MAARPAVSNPVPMKSVVPKERQRRPTAEIFRGNGQLTNNATVNVYTSGTNGGGKGITLNFVNADVRDVAKAVLGDLLKLNYTVDSTIQGGVTIQTSRPLPREAVLAAFEQALSLSGISLVQEDDIYRVVPSAAAPHQPGVALLPAQGDEKRPGFAVEIVPLRYVGAEEIQKLLDPLLPPGGVLQVDRTRNLVFLSGDTRERALIRNEIAVFDVDYLAGMSFALFTPKSIDAKSLADDLREVIGGAKSPLAGVVNIIVLERQNSVLAISPQPRYLDQLRLWVDRFDRPAETTERRVFVYRVQNGRASDLARVLNAVLTGKQAKEANNPRPETALPTPQIATAPIGGTGLPMMRSGSQSSPDDRPQGTSGLDEPNGANREGRPTLTITADEVNNALVILATPKEYAVIEAALGQLDVPPIQVMLEAAIAEVDLTKKLEYGVQYYFQGGNHQVAQTNTASLNITPTLPGFSYLFSSGTNIQIILSALDDVTHVNVISAPKIMVLNNQTATLQVGDEVPIATSQAESVLVPGAPLVNTIQFQDTGIILKVTPRVNRSGTVMMDISQEVSDVSTTTTSTLNSPTISERKITSAVAVHDGETIALGGLIKDSRTTEKAGIPLLKDIPYVGTVFGSNKHDVDRTELLVLITPHVVDTLARAQSVTDELRRKLPFARDLIEQMK